MVMRSICPLLMAVLLLSACGTPTVNPVTGRTERTVMDEAAEIENGARAHTQVVEEYGAYANPGLQAYVDALGQKLASRSHRTSLKWTFTVLDSPEVNAFALPGGYVYVTRGIMAYLESEAELAGVIGHEIGHVTARHSAQQATQEQRAGIGVTAATMLGLVLEAGGVRGAANLASQVSKVTAAGYVASYSRDQESQADELGAEYLARNRYDPQNMVDAIFVLKRQEQFVADAAKAEGKPAPSGSNWLSSHPANDKRLADIKAFAAKYKGRDAYADVGRARYLQAIAGMTFGDSAERAFVRGRDVYHARLGIALTAPPGWKIQSSSGGIVFVNGAADASIVVRLVLAAAGKTHEEVIRDMVQPIDGQSEPRTLHGMPATHFSGTHRGEQGQPRPIALTLVTGPGERTYWLQYMARNADARQRAEPGWKEAESSFRQMSPAERAAAKPLRLQIVPYPGGGFSELAKSSALPPAKAEAELRLVNGAYGGGANPKPGQLVKVVD